MNNDLVKVHKDFINLNIGLLGEKELELFYYICLRTREKKDKVIEIDFSSIRKALGDIKKSDLKKYIVGLQHKLASLKITSVSEKEISTIILFDKLTNVIEEDKLIVRVTESSLYFFNSAGRYLRFLFSDVRKLKGKYSKLLIPYLMDKSNKKEAEFEKERFFNILEIDEKYKNDLSNFNRIILKPAIEELRKIFENLKVEPQKNGRVIKGYKFTWTNDFNFQNKKDDIEEAEVVEEKENIAPEELEKYFKTTFPGVNYSKKHKEVLEKLLKNNSLEYIKKYLSEQWEYVQNDKNILNKSAYFSKLILEEKAVYKNHLPTDYEELKKETEPIQRTREISSIKGFSSPINLKIPKENEEKKVITRSEYKREKEKWIIEQKKAPVYNEKIALQIFEIKMKNYEIIEDEVKEENIEIKTISRFDYEYKKLEWLEIQKQSNSYNEKMAIRVFEEKMKDYKIIEEDYEEIIAEAKEKYDIEEVILDDDEGGVPNLDFLDNEDDELLELSLKKAEEKKLNELTMKDVENYIKDSPNFLEVIKNLVREEEMKKQQEKNKMKYKDFLEKYSDKLKSKAGKKLTGVALRFKAIALAKKMEIEITDLYKKRGIL